MITVAFCDDDLLELDNMKLLMDSYHKDRQVDLNCVTYQSPYELLHDIERGTRYQILFLDVLMPGQNGVDVAGEIRAHDESVKIIFLTSSSEFAVQSYSVGAYFYQLKPICQDSFFRLMDSVLTVCEKEQFDCLMVHSRNYISRIPIKELEYCEVIGRTLFLHLKSGKVIEMSGRMDELSRKLEPFGNFLRVHRSYLINLDFVQTLSPRKVSMACLVDIPIPHGKYNEIKDIYLEYIFQGGDETLDLVDCLSE